MRGSSRRNTGLSLGRERVPAERVHRQRVLNGRKPVAQLFFGVGQRPRVHRVPVVDEHPIMVGQKDRDVEPVVIGDHPAVDVSSRIPMRIREGLAQPALLRIDRCSPPLGGGPTQRGYARALAGSPAQRLGQGLVGLQPRHSGDRGSARAGGKGYCPRAALEEDRRRPLDATLPRGEDQQRAAVPSARARITPRVATAGVSAQGEAMKGSPRRGIGQPQGRLVSCGYRGTTVRPLRGLAATIGARLVGSAAVSTGFASMSL